MVLKKASSSERNLSSNSVSPLRVEIGYFAIANKADAYFIFQGALISGSGTSVYFNFLYSSINRAFIQY